MAVIECPECNKKVSDKLPYCVFCKHKFRSTQDSDYPELTQPKPPEFNYKRVAAAVGIAVFLGYLFIWPAAKPKNYANSNPGTSVTPNAEQRSVMAALNERDASQNNRRSQIERQFSAWDGSHRPLVRRVKESMKNPDSFEHVKTTYTEQGDMLLVLMTYRGKNSFNAVVTQRVYAEVTLDGTIMTLKETY